MNNDSISALSLTQPRLSEVCRRLASDDPMLARILEAHGEPPLWGRPANFATLALIILEQQVSLKSAAAINRRIREACGGRVSARKVADLGEAGLRQLGVTRQKSRYISLLAKAVHCRTLSLSNLHLRTPEAARQVLVAQKGIGVWTCEVYLLMALRYQDAFPQGDLALIRELNARKGTGMDWDEVMDYAERWRPFRAAAARILWVSYLAR